MTGEIETEETASRGVKSFLKRWASDWGSAWIVLFGVILAAYTAFLFLPWGTAGEKVLISNIFSVVIFLGPATLAVRVAMHPGVSTRGRFAWGFIGLANLSFSLGSALWIYHEDILGEQPFPSWADAGYLAFYPLMLGGLLLLAEKMRSAQERLKFVLDAGIIVLGAGMALWYFLLGPIANAGDGDALKTSLSLAYPIGDLVMLLGVAALLLRPAASGSRGPINLILFGVVVNFVYDVIFAYQNLSGTYTGGSALDALFSVPAIPIMLAAHIYYVRASDEPSNAVSPAAIGSRYFWTPYIAVAAVLFVQMRVAIDGDSDKMLEAVLLSTVAAVFVISRQVMFILENTRANSALSEMQERIQGIYSASTDAIGLAEFGGTITEVNESFIRLTGLSREEILGKMSFLRFVPEDYLERSFTPEMAIEGRRPIEYERELVRKDGTSRNVTTTLFAVHNSVGAPAAMAVVIRDITDRRQLERQLTYQALHDPLTGLANRVLLTERVAAALSRARRLRTEIAVMFIDLDNFKTVNDTMGHAAGDSLLATVSDRIRSCLRSSDTAARLGGDEFAVLIEDIKNPHEELAVADRILTAIRTPVEINGKQAFVGASIGIAMSTASVIKSDDLLRNADVAMYTAKREGKNRFSVYEDVMHAAVVRRAELEAEIRSAILNEEFELHYQPIVNLQDSRIVAIETLLRWNHPRGIAIGPAEFIPIAEEANLIGELGNWVLRESCSQAARWQKEFCQDEPFSLSVNISGRQFMDASFVDTVKSAYTAARLDPATLILEITESTMLVNTEATIEKLIVLRDLGVKLAVDDFGTGYSSLSYLHRFPIDVLKIDRSFVEKITEGEQAEAMARAVVSMSDTLRLTTIAEGVETEDQAAALKGLGCSWGQGYHFARPLTVADMEGFFAKSGEQESIHFSHGGPAAAVPGLDRMVSAS